MFEVSHGAGFVDMLSWNLFWIRYSRQK